MSQNLPSRALTKAASDLGAHRRWMKERGGTQESYRLFYAGKYSNGRPLYPEDIDILFLKDVLKLEELEKQYNTLQAER